MSLLTKIALVVGGVTALMIAGASLFVFNSTRTALQAEIQKSQDELGRHTMENIDQMLYRYMISIENIAEEEHIERTLNGALTDRSVIQRRIKELPFLTGPWDILEIYDVSGEIIVSYDGQESGDHLMSARSNAREALERALQGEIYYSDFFVSRFSNRPTMIFAAPIRDQEQADSPIVGAVIGNVAWPAIIEMLREIDPNTEVNLFTHDGTFIGTNSDETDLLYARNDRAAAFISTLSRDVQVASTILSSDFEGVAGRSELMTSVHSQGYLGYQGFGWVLLFETPTSVVFAPAVRTAQSIVIFLLPVVILATVMMVLFLRRIVVRPVTKLTEMTRIIANGDFSRSASISSNDEIGQLSASIDTMALKLKETYGNLERKVEEKTAELSNQVFEVEKSKSAILNLLEDIEEEKKKVEDIVVERTRELANEKARLLASINSLSFGFVIADINDMILLKNPAMSRILGTEKYETVADVTEILGSVHLLGSCKECMASQELVEMKDISYDKKFLRVMCAPILGENKTIGYVFILEDITETKVMERSRDEFFAVASHELRTPLTAIRGNADMILEMYADKIPDKDMKEMLADINTSSVRLIDVVNDFLEVSRLEQGKIAIKSEKFDVQEVVEKVMRDLREMIVRKGLSLEFIPPAAPIGLISADKSKTEQVLVNLLGNAAKFSKEGGIKLTMIKSGSQVRISVTDTGTGISAQNQPLLFRKFQQAGEQMLARDVAQSTGLGLYICKLIVENMKGTIGLEKSELGKGSTFYFTLPLA